MSTANLPSGRGAPPGSVALTGRRPLAGDHPRPPAISSERTGPRRWR